METSDGDPPVWLDTDERAVWLALIGLTIRLPRELDRQLRRDAGISHFDYQVLALLSEAPERTLRMSALADRVEGSLPRLSQVVSRLERDGWIRRHPDPSDGRSTLATLTGSGWELLVGIAPGHVATVRRLVFDPLSTRQVDQLGRIATTVLGAIDADAAQATKY
ncbi:MAG: MarR family winged helix-turn-helix transcriptional regulator [Acidimicrobiales bacterium]